jgi:hypothetical protein
MRHGNENKPIRHRHRRYRFQPGITIAGRQRYAGIGDAYRNASGEPVTRQTGATLSRPEVVPGRARRDKPAGTPGPGWAACLLPRTLTNQVLSAPQ